MVITLTLPRIFKPVQAAYGLRRHLRNLAALTLTLSLLAVPKAYAAEKLQILALGDSLTAGYGLEQGEGMVPQLNQWLATQGAAVEVINGGVSGDTSAGGLSRLNWSLTPEIRAMIVTLGGNDMLRGLPPTETRKNITAILTEAQSRQLPVLLIGLKAPGNFGPDYQQSFDALYPELAAEFETLLVDSYFGLIDPEARDLSELEGLMLADGIHPNADGIKRLTDALGPHVKALAEQVQAAQ